MSAFGRVAFSLALVTGLAGSGVPARAELPTLPVALTIGDTSVVAAVVDGDTVRLADGRDVRLVGIEAPKPAPGGRNRAMRELAGQAISALESLVLGRAVTLHYGGRESDRHGRRLAQLSLADGSWVQGILLRRGMARVRSFADNRALVHEMLEQERAARAARRGIWSHPAYAIRSARIERSDLGTVQIVEDRVREVAEVRGKVYLNFGADWRTDFTVVLDRHAAARFRRAGLEPLALRDRRIRVRGWLDDYNGPMIAATHPEQIELLTD